MAKRKFSVERNVYVFSLTLELTLVIRRVYTPGPVEVFLHVKTQGNKVVKDAEHKVLIFHKNAQNKRLDFDNTMDKSKAIWAHTHVSCA